MYLNFYRLSQEPFSLTPDPEFFYLGPGHREAFASACYGVEHGKGFACITGEVGTGKTTVARTYLARRLGRNIVPVYLFNAHLNFDELVATILRELGDNDPPASCTEMLRRLYDRLIASHVAGRVVALFIDEAQNLDVQTLEGLRMLSNLETRKQKLLQIILIGQPELETKLQRNDLRQLSQRIAVHAIIEPLSRKESIAYIRHRISVAADKPGEVFTPAALRLIARQCKGIPRRLNILCDRSLLEGYAAQERPAGVRMVRAALARRRGPLQRPLFRRLTLALGALALIAMLSAGYPYLASKPARPEESPVVEAAVLPEDSPGESHAIPPVAQKKNIVVDTPNKPTNASDAPAPHASQAPGRTAAVEPSWELPRLKDSLGEAGAAMPQHTPRLVPVMDPPAPLMPKQATWAVHPGDTLTDIIRATHGEVTDEAIEAVRALNPQIRNANLIFPGELITLPRQPADGPADAYALLPWNGEKGG